MNFKQQQYVDEDQNIVTEIQVIMSPREFLQRNTEVFQFAESMRPGAQINQQKAIGRGDGN